MTTLYIILGCFVVGLSIGWCGIAGFLLPILFMSACGYLPIQAMFLSFCCFLLSGIIGSVNYARRGDLPLNLSLVLASGSLFGGVLGAILTSHIPTATVKTILYLIVLLSGISIILQYLMTRNHHLGEAKPRSQSRPLLFLIGFVTAVLCALSGAGGPVLVMPILVLLGIRVRESVAIALFDSIFIALPAIVVYGVGAHAGKLLLPLLIALVSHAAGISLGSRTAHKISQHVVKAVVVVISISLSLVMLLR